jgi:putative transposase
VKKHQNQYPVEVLCKVLGVSRSGFYKWLGRCPSKRSVRREKLLMEIKTVHKESHGNYGSPRVHEQLKLNGTHCNRKTVEKLMSKNGIRSKTKRRFKATTNSKHNKPVAENLLNREFHAAEPDQKWVSDVTYVWTDEGWLYLAVFIDLFSRMVVGWSMSSRMTEDLVIDALRMGLMTRGKKVSPLVHSDQGSQYASDAFRAELEFRGCQQSMSRKGNCWDNSVSESFFGSLKTELIHHEQFKTRKEAEQKTFDYIEVFYNRQRLHSSLNYMPPAKFEECFARTA